MTYGLISADSHINEAPDLWETRLPKALRERGPRLVRTAGRTGPVGDRWARSHAAHLGHQCGGPARGGPAFRGPRNDHHPRRDDARLLRPRGAARRHGHGRSRCGGALPGTARGPRRGRRSGGHPGHGAASRIHPGLQRLVGGVLRGRTATVDRPGASPARVARVRGRRNRACCGYGTTWRRRQRDAGHDRSRTDLQPRLRTGVAGGRIERNADQPPHRPQPLARGDHGCHVGEQSAMPETRCPPADPARGSPRCSSR